MQMETGGEDAARAEMGRVWGRMCAGVEEPRVRSFEELLERVPRAEVDARHEMPGSKEVLERYWDLLLMVNRRPTRAECDRWLPRWRGFFRNFRDLEDVTWRSEGERFGRRMGLPLEGSVMVREPVNEQGVVLLFGSMARALGFEVEWVGTSYPDCVGRRLVGGVWRPVRIEFEFLSSRFDHDPNGCDLVVCWEDDAKESRVEVLALKGQVVADVGLRRADGGEREGDCPARGGSASGRGLGGALACGFSRMGHGDFSGISV